MDENRSINDCNETQAGAFNVLGGIMLEILTDVPMVILNRKPEKGTGTDIIMNRDLEFHITLKGVNMKNETGRISNYK